MSRVRLRLFASAREAAGRPAADVDAATLGELLARARAVYGADFAAVLDTARVWVNGDEPADGDATTLRDGDEVAVLPPVSGGCVPAAASRRHRTGTRAGTSLVSVSEPHQRRSDRIAGPACVAGMHLAPAPATELRRGLDHLLGEAP